MKVRNLISGTARVVSIAPGAQAGTSAGTQLIDMADYESVLFILIYAGSLSAANTPVLSANYGNQSGGGDQAAVPNTQTAALSKAASFQSLEIFRPSKRYVCPIVTCNGSPEYYAVVAILTPKNQPGGPQGPQGPRSPGIGLVPQTPTFNTTGANAGEYAGGGYLTSTLTAAEEYASLVANV